MDPKLPLGENYNIAQYFCEIDSTEQLRHDTAIVAQGRKTAMHNTETTSQNPENMKHKIDVLTDYVMNIVYIMTSQFRTVAERVHRLPQVYNT
eukprot:5276037-Amphidinium_carterae.1